MTIGKAEGSSPSSSTTCITDSGDRISELLPHPAPSVTTPTPFFMPVILEAAATRPHDGAQWLWI